MRKITEKETLLFNEIQINNLEKVYHSEPDKFFELSNLLNILIYQNNRKDLSWEWGNEYGINVFELNKEIKPNFEIIRNKSDENFLKSHLLKINKFNIKNDKYSVLNYFQYFQTHGSWKYILTNKKILNDKYFISISYFLEDFGNIGKFISKQLDYTFSNINAWQKFQSLTKREKEILKLIVNGKNTKEISDTYCVSENTTRKHRENINRKTDCNKIHDLIRFADSFQLIGEL